MGDDKGGRKKMTEHEELASHDAAVWNRNSTQGLERSFSGVRKKTGKALIVISNKTYLNDLINLENFFTKQGLVVQTQDCPTRTEFVLGVLDFANSFKDGDFNCSVVVVLSHGKNGNILASDGKEMAVENDIIGRFDNTDCPELRGKPKFFLLHTILDEGENEIFKTLYLRRKVKNALALQSATLESERILFLETFYHNFNDIDFANIDNPIIENEKTSLQRNSSRSSWWLKINTSQFDSISKDLFNCLRIMGFSVKELLTYFK